MKNSNDTIGNRTRDPPAFSAVPQPTAPPLSLVSRPRIWQKDHGSIPDRAKASSPADRPSHYFIRLVPRAFSRGLGWPRSETNYVTQTCAEDTNVSETLLQSRMYIHISVLY
jgi:hypothetical protein